MQGIAVMGILKAQFDLLVLAFFVGPAEIGVYSITKRLAGLVSLPGLVSSMFVVPRIVRWELAGSSSKKSIVNILQINSFVCLFLVVCISVAVIFFSGHISHYLNFNSDEFVRVLLLLSLGNIFIVVGGPCVGLLTLQGSERWVIRNTLLTVVVSILLMIGLGFVWKEYGVAFGSSIGQIVFIALCVHQYRKINGIDTSILGLFDLKK
jgi:O-antigen/teichoic acid export membrane protein